MLQHMSRWIKASFIQELKKHLKGKALYVEGEDRLTNKESEFIELRLDGPYIDPCGTRGEYYAYIEVNLLCTSTRNEQNRYAADNLRGLMLQILTRDVCIYRTGNENDVVDDASYVGLMKLMPKDKIKASNFGQIDDASQTFQSVVEAHYEMYFKLNVL